MCGLVLLKRNDNHSPVKPLLARYNEQKHRGQQGFGFVAVRKGRVIGYERDTTFDGIEKKLQAFNSADEILFHHRMPTSTKNLEETAHPIFVSNRILKHDYYLIHNGVITNPEKLKVEHEKLGFEYNTEVELFAGYKQKHSKKNKKKQRYEVTKTEFNDSEALAVEFALFNEGIKPEIETVGSAAFIAYEVTKDTKQVVAMHYGRNNNPIKAFRAHGMFTLTSESKDQGHVEVDDYKLVTIPYKDGVQTVGTIKPMRLDASLYSSRTSGWSGSSTDTSYSYPSASGHSHSKIGYDASRSRYDCGLEDDFDDVPSRNNLRLSHAVAQSYAPALPFKPSNSCSHGMVPKTSCVRCEDEKESAEPESSSNVIEITCGRTGLVITKCHCKMHRKEMKRLKRASKNNPTNTQLGIESPYMDNAGKKYCNLCDNKIVGAQYFNKNIKDWVHFECAPNDSNDVVSNDYTERLEANYARIDSEIDELKNTIGTLTDLVSECDTDNSRVEEWFTASGKLEQAQKKLDDKERELGRVAQFMDGSLF